MRWSDTQVEDFYSVVGSRIKDARAQARMTQTDLAERLGLTRSSVANIEAGRQRVQLHWLVEMSRELDVSLHYLVDAPLPGQKERLAIPGVEHEPETTIDFVNAAVRRARRLRDV